MDMDTDNVSDDEYDEELVYIDLDEVPNIQELFSIKPDDHLLLQNKRQREKPVLPKPTVSDLTLRFYNLESEGPVLRLGKTFFTGSWIDTVGSSLFFHKQDDTTTGQQFEYLIPENPTNHLNEIPPDNVFGENVKSKSKHSPARFNLVANVKKVLKLTRRDLSCIESSASARVVHDEERFMPSFYIDKEMRDKVEILQLLGMSGPKDFKFKWDLKKGENDITELSRLNNDDDQWEDISDSDLSEDEGSSSSCDEVDEEAYEAYLKIREELNYETRNFNFSKSKKGNPVDASEAFKQRYSAPYYLNRRKVVTRLNSMLASANVKRINVLPKRKQAVGTSRSLRINVVERPNDNTTTTPEAVLIDDGPRKFKFVNPTFYSKDQLKEKSKPSYNPSSALKSTTTRLVLPDELIELIQGTGTTERTNPPDGETNSQ